MADWVEGHVQLSGKRSNLIQFLLDGLIPLGNSIEIRNSKSKFEMLTPDSDYLIVDSDRHYLSCHNITMDHQKSQVIECQFSAAFEINTQLLESISKQFNINIAIRANTPADYVQKVNIIKGKVIQDDLICSCDLA
ncbi:hypothetical protein M3573_18790 [Bacillus safensis]|uniref:hypothetical protein n=1 Tax=Bacillus safensis TaxID=561879 RepID=UPI0020409103|nr:hypothetical protein [Bacillus safensis]MCM3140325.1 hypothetical protein [Bacillus safensis]